MKKTLIVLMMVALVLATAFAATGTDDIQLKSQVGAVLPGSDLNGLLTIACTTTDYTTVTNGIYTGLKIDTNQTATTTELAFQVKNTSLVRLGTTDSPKSFEVTVTPGAFKLNGAGTDIVPVNFVKGTESSWAESVLTVTYAASAQVNPGTVMGTFKLNWTPKANLAMGEYISDVIINVTATT